MPDDRAGATDLAEGALQYLRDNHSPAKMVSDTATIYHAVVQAGRLELASAR